MSIGQGYGSTAELQSRISDLRAALNSERERVREVEDAAAELSADVTALGQQLTAAQATIEQMILAKQREQSEPVRWMCPDHGDVSRVQRVGWTPLFTATQPLPEGMTVLDIADDDVLRFAQRVLEGAATEQDRQAARDGLVAIRTRVRKANTSPQPLPEGMVMVPREPAWFAEFTREWDHFKHMGKAWKERFWAALITAAEKEAKP